MSLTESTEFQLETKKELNELIAQYLILLDQYSKSKEKLAQGFSNASKINQNST